MSNTSDMTRVLSNVRLRICPKCARFGIACTGAAAGEAEGKCDLVNELPRLVQISRRRDPMVGASTQSFIRAIDETLAEPAASRPKVLRRFRNEVAALLTQVNVDEEHRTSREDSADHRIDCL